MKKSALVMLAIVTMFYLLPPLESLAQADATDPARLISSSSSGVEFELSLNPQELQTGVYQTELESLTTLAYRDWGLTSIAGEPQLPFTTVMLAVPFGAKVNLKVQTGTALRLPLQFKLSPAPLEQFPADYFSQPGGTEMQVPDMVISYPLNPEVFSVPALYPGPAASIGGDGILRDQRIVSVKIYPLQYQPVDNSLLVFEQVRVKVEFTDFEFRTNLNYQTSNSPFDSVLAGQLLNAEEAPAFKLTDAQVQSETGLAQPAEGAGLGSYWVPPEESWKVGIGQPGVYALTYALLLEADVLQNDPDPRLFALYYQGQQLSIEVTGEADGHFDAEDQIIFWAGPFDYKYSAEDVYWLTIGESAGRRVQQQSDPLTNPLTVSSFMAVQHFEENSFYRSFLPGDDSLERYLWYFVNNSQPWVSHFNVTDPSDGSGTLNLRLFGYFQNPSINPDHHAKIYLNDQFLGEAMWEGQTWITVSVQMQGFLVVGDNTLRVETPADLGISYDIAGVDWFDIEYSSRLTATNDRLIITQPEAGEWHYDVTGFTDPQAQNMRVYTISDPYNIKSMSNFNYLPDGSIYTLSFEAEVAEAETFLTFGTGSLMAPVFVQSYEPPDWLDSENPLEMLIVSHSSFSLQAERLAEYKRSTGLETLAVEVQSVYDIFNYGVQDVRAIRGFLAYALENWGTEYVLLFGDGHYDPKNHLGYNQPVFIPPYLAFSDPWWGETASDNHFVYLVGDDLLPDMMIGRLTPEIEQQAETTVDKILAYSQADDDNWINRVLSVADNADSGGDFNLIASNLFNEVKPDYITLSKVHFGVNYTDLTAAQDAIRDEINSGVAIINYIGHASYSAWAVELLFSTSAVSNLTNEEMLPVVLAMTCMEGYFLHPYRPDQTEYDANLALAEEMTRATKNGAIATWSPTGLGIVTGHDYLNRGFLEEFFSSENVTLGQATLRGINNLWATGNNLDLLETYMIFGDPSIQLPKSFHAIADSYQTTEDYPLSITAENGVIANDSNPDVSAVIAELVNPAEHGEINLKPDGSFEFMPETNFFGAYSFEYRLKLGDTYSNVATVTITVNPVNDPPLAQDQQIITVVDTPVDLELGVEDDGGIIPFTSGQAIGGHSSIHALTYEIINQPTFGTLSGDAPHLHYEPNQNFMGLDTLSFIANDGQYDSNLAEIQIFVLNTLDSPIARQDTFQVFSGTTLQVASPGILANDKANRTGGTLTASLLEPPASGQLDLATDGSFSFIAEPEFFGVVTFTYEAQDGDLISNPALVTIVVMPQITNYLPMILR